MTPTAADLAVLAVPLLVLAVALAVFAVDLILPLHAGRPVEPPGVGTVRRGVGAVAALGLVGVLAATWLVRADGPAMGGAFVQDAYALYLQRIALLAGALGVLGSIDHADRRFPDRQGEYYLMLVLSVAGMTLLAGARELVLLVVAFELMGIPLYVLAAMHKTEAEGVEGALKLYLVGAVSTAITLYGLSFLVAHADSTRIAELLAREPTPMAVLGMALVLAGMGFKVGAVPFHLWIPDTYQSAPAPFVAFLSVGPKAAGFAALVRIFIEGLNAARDAWWPVLLAIAVATMVLGNLFAVPQRNVRRILAFSGISHIGLLLVAFGIGTAQGLGVLLFYLTAYTFTNMGAFFVVQAVGRTRSDDLDDWRGLARQHPALSLAMLIFLLSLGGIPFVAGFWAKLMLFWAAWERGLGLVVFLGVALAVLALFYYLKVARSIYIEAPAEGAEPLPPLGRPTAFAIAIALAGVVGMGVVPGLFLDPALAAARALLGG